MSPIRVGLLGFGYWGPNLARNVQATRGLDLTAIGDTTGERAWEALRAYPQARVYPTTSAEGALRDVDAVVIATPASTHHALAAEALRAGKHVLVTKPLAETVEQAEELVELAARRDLVLMVDHTFVYTGACEKLLELRLTGKLGELLSYDSVRISLGLVQPDVNVLWDLAPHDLAILDRLGFGQPGTVSVVAADPIGCGKASAAHLFLTYASGFAAAVHVSWFSPVKVRRIMLAGSRRHVVYDDVEPTEKVKVYDATVQADARTRHVDYRVGDIVAPKLDFREALAVEMEHFDACIRGEEKPITDGCSGVRVVRTLAAAERSLMNGGRQELI